VGSFCTKIGVDMINKALRGGQAYGYPCYICSGVKIQDPQSPWSTSLETRHRKRIW